MAYDRDLADRLRALLGAEADVTEKAMFGGRAFLVGGHLAVSASSRGGLLLRADPGSAERLLGDPRTEPFQMRGRALPGWVHVLVDADVADGDLRRWVAGALNYVRSLPPKSG